MYTPIINAQGYKSDGDLLSGGGKGGAGKNYSPAMQGSIMLIGSNRMGVLLKGVKTRLAGGSTNPHK